MQIKSMSLLCAPIADHDRVTFRGSPNPASERIDELREIVETYNFFHFCVLWRDRQHRPRPRTSIATSVTKDTRTSSFNGLLAMGLFRRVFIDHAEHYVVLDPW